jgi:hypothetical protein
MIPASYAINPDFFVYTFDPTHICILKILMLQRIPDLEEVMPVLGPTYLTHLLGHIEATR